MNQSTNQPFPQLRYCVRCCLPETSEGLNFDELGICKACRSSEMKMHINWAEREERLREILEEAKQQAKDNVNYDCVIPISGGKDSCFQLHVLCNVYKMKPLCCTFSANWWTETGKWNLQNCLEQFNVDHVMFTPNRQLINKLARQSLVKIGDSCWHCHAGVGAWPLQVAEKFKIPLIIWGESAAEFGSKATYEDVIEFDENYYLKVSTKVHPSKMVSSEISEQDLLPFQIPSRGQLEKVGIRGIHLGDYIFWDGERQVEFIKKEYGWREDKVEGTYKGYKSVECRMTGVHDYAKWVKRGFGRATDHASIDVRNGLLSREEGLELAGRIDSARPGELDYYLSITGYSEEEFLTILESQRQGKAKDLPKVPRPHPSSHE